MSDDDFEDDDTLDVDLDDDDSFDDFEGQEQTLGDLWRNNPAIKAGVIVGAGLLVLVSFFMFGGGGSSEPPAESFVAPGADVAGTPGSEQVSPNYREAVEEQNETIAEEAKQTGGSAIPTPIDPPVSKVPLLSEPEKKEDPLQRWRKLQEERLEREIERKKEAQAAAPPPQAAPVQDPAATVDQEQVIADLAGAMADQMQAVLENRSQPSVQSVTINSKEYLKRMQEEASGIDATGRQGNTGANAANNNPEARPEPKILFPAGQIAYAQLLIEANTDVPGPVLAQIHSGPLKGNRILGTFQEQNELLTLRFNTVVIDGKSQSIDAIALDPNTSLGGMATEVDHRYFKRILLPMAADFVEGAARAISDSGRTNVTIQGETVTESTNDTTTEEEIASGIEEAGDSMSNIIEQIAANTRVMVRIAAGTPMGVLFMSPVIEQNADANQSNTGRTATPFNRPTPGSRPVSLPNLNN